MSGSDRPRLLPKVRIQTDRVTGEPVLLYPEGLLKLNPTAAAIIELCDGNRTVSEIVTELAQAHSASPGDVEADVFSYLERLHTDCLLAWE